MGGWGTTAAGAIQLHVHKAITIGLRIWTIKQKEKIISLQKSPSGTYPSIRRRWNDYWWLSIQSGYAIKVSKSDTSLTSQQGQDFTLYFHMFHMD